jgi:hypothetical protein
MTKLQTQRLQRELNHFTSKYLKGVNKLSVDGRFGFLTKRRIMTAKWYLGYGKKRDADATEAFRQRLRNPGQKRFFHADMYATGRRRRREQRNRWIKNQIQSYLKPGVTRFEGKPVAKCAVPYLNYARSRGWRGGVNSGWRDPNYSRQLCIQMCGAPSCPGRCAGTASNHVGNSCANFAIDVSDYYTFGNIMRTMPLRAGMRRIFNALGARDPVHFSPSGR